MSGLIYIKAPLIITLFVPIIYSPSLGLFVRASLVVALSISRLRRNIFVRISHSQTPKQRNFLIP